jgi:hypothetical protein
MIDCEDSATYDDGYYSLLSEDDTERFDDDFRNNLDEFDAEDIQRRLRASYDKQHEHLKLVRAAGACFHVREGAATESGFELYGTNPLCVTRDTPADLVAVKNEHNCVYVLLIFCEIGGERRGEWIENVNETWRFFRESETESLLRKRLNVNRRDIELGYATLTREDDTFDLDFSILNRQCNASPYSIWECDTGDRWIRHLDGQFLHPDLRAVFADDVDYSRRNDPIEFSVGAHPVVPLKETIFKIQRENRAFDADNPDEFNRSTLVDYIDDQIKAFTTTDNSDAVVEAEVDRILTAGLQARILDDDPTEVESGDYKVVYSGTRGPEFARDAVEPRYFKYMPEYEIGRKAYEKTKDEFERSTGLGDFG